MKKLLLFTIIAGFGCSMLGMAGHADARRFGGGMSFGKQRMFRPSGQSRMFNRWRAAPGKSPTAGQRSRPAGRRGLMGMLGGLALGGLLGSMFFGGAFGGINLFDIVVIGAIIAFVLMLRRRSALLQQPSSGWRSPSSMRDYAQNFAHDSKSESNEAARRPVGAALRPKIDERHFISSAKEIYVRMQKAWDSGDIEDIRRFCTHEVAARIGKDMRPDETHRTEIATINATIADSWIESDLEWVAVNYAAMLREQTMDASGAKQEEQAAEVNEIWIFQHDPNSEDPTWYLAGIQQVN